LLLLKEKGTIRVSGAAFAAEFDFLSVENALLPFLACVLSLLAYIGGDFCFSHSSPVLESFLAIALHLAADICASTLLLGLLLLPSFALKPCACSTGLCLRAHYAAFAHSTSVEERCTEPFFAKRFLGLEKRALLAYIWSILILLS
jgi:hypothetical protein